VSSSRAARRVGVAVSGLVAVVALTGCGDNPPPGAASVVNGHKISASSVDDLAHAQCTAANRASAQGQTQAAPLARVQALSLGLLIDTELTKQYAADLDLSADPSLVTGFYSQIKPGIDPLPQPARGILTKVFTDYAKGRALLVEAGSQKTGQAVSLDNLQQLLDAGSAARATWEKGATITTDARYGPTKDGFPGAGGGSVSKAVSSYAKQADKTEPSQSFVSGLPAKQKCG
jgi:hypothetical protein